MSYYHMQPYLVYINTSKAIITYTKNKFNIKTVIKFPTRYRIVNYEILSSYIIDHGQPGLTLENSYSKSYQESVNK